MQRYRSRFGTFWRFHDPVPRFGSNLGCKGYFRYKKHWDTIHKKNDQFGIKHHQQVQFGAFQRFRDAMLGSSSNLGCKGYARYKKHWDTTYVQNMLFAAFYLDS